MIASTTVTPLHGTVPSVSGSGGASGAQPPRTQVSPNPGNRADFIEQYVSFHVDKHLFGIPVGLVQEVLNPQAIAPVPLAPKEVAGLLNLRGQIVTALNLRRRLGMPDIAEVHAGMNVVVRYRGESYSLLVDEVADVIDISQKSLEPPPRAIAVEWRRFVAGVSRLEGELLLVLDLTTVLAFGEH